MKHLVQSSPKQTVQTQYVYLCNFLGTVKTKCKVLTDESSVGKGKIFVSRWVSDLIHR